MSAEINRIDEQYRNDGYSADYLQRIEDARVLKSAGYTIQQAFLSSPIFANSGARKSEERILTDELNKWHKSGEGVAGPYVDFAADDESRETFAPEAAIAYWKMLEK